MTALPFYNRKKVFVTGHTGFKGTWLCRMLLHAGAEVTGYALEPPTEPSLFVQTGTARDVRSVTGDVRDREGLAAAMSEASPEVVFHLAAQPLVRLSYREPALTYETNVMGTVNVLEALRRTPGVRSFVNVTTDKVYENKEWLWGYREDERLCGLDPYSNSKSCGELATFSYRAAFFTGGDAPAVSTARGGNVIGGGDYSADRIIPDCVRAATAGRRIVLRDPGSVRPYQHVLECLSGYLLLAERQHADRGLAGAYNFGPGGDGCVTTGRLATLFCESWGGGASWVGRPGGGPHEATTLKLDCAKAKAALGWAPSWDVGTAVEKVVEFAKAAGDAERTACVDRQIAEFLGGSRG
jgi:CDP-glucose 4,6-dehydratase